MSHQIPMKLRDWVDKSKINWDDLSSNPNAIQLLEKNPDKIYWSWLSRNPNAIKLLEQNPDNIDWANLSHNKNAIHLLEKHDYSELDWEYLSLNPNAIHILEQNQHKIDWSSVSTNPSIFVYDYEEMKQNNRELKEELIQAAWHPSRIVKWLEQGVELDDL